MFCIWCLSFWYYLEFRTNMHIKKRITSFTIGFTLSLILTLAAYLAVVDDIFSGWVLLTVILIIAVIQFAVQLIFFLSLGQEAKPRWKLVIFVSTLGLVLIIMLGSLWIMNHLNYNMSSSVKSIENYTNSQDGF